MKKWGESAKGNEQDEKRKGREVVRHQAHRAVARWWGESRTTKEVKERKRTGRKNTTLSTRATFRACQECAEHMGKQQKENRKEIKRSFFT